MKKSKIAWGFVALAALIVVFVGFYESGRPTVSEGDKVITVTVAHRDGDVVTHTYQTNDEYLGELLQGEGLVEGEMGPYGLYITTVAGEVADYDKDGSYWALYQGEEYAMQSADLTPLNDGDEFSLVYTIG